MLKSLKFWIVLSACLFILTAVGIGTLSERCDYKLSQAISLAGHPLKSMALFKAGWSPTPSGFPRHTAREVFSASWSPDFLLGVLGVCFYACGGFLFLALMISVTKQLSSSVKGGGEKKAAAAH